MRNTGGGAPRLCEANSARPGGPGIAHEPHAGALPGSMNGQTSEKKDPEAGSLPQLGTGKTAEPDNSDDSKSCMQGDQGDKRLIE